MTFGQVYDEVTKYETLFKVLPSESQAKSIIFFNLFWWLETTKYNLTVN
jgi:hypothetical protein